MFSTDFIFRQQENLLDNQKSQAGFRPLCNKIRTPYIRYPTPTWEFTQAQKIKCLWHGRQIYNFRKNLTP